MADRLDVLFVRARIDARITIDAALAAKLEDPRAKAAQERAVVRDEDHRAVEIFERFDQHFFRGQVQMVGRLVEHQKVRRIEKHARHCETGFLAAGKRSDALVHIITGELERAGQRAQRAEAFLAEIFLKLLDDGEVGIEHIERLLREVSHSQACAEPHASAVRRARAGDHFEQRGLARAIPAHHGPTFSAPDGEAEAVVDHARAVALAEIFDDGHLVAGSRRDAELELHDLAFLRQLDLLDLVERLDAALHLRRFGRVCFETLDEGAVRQPAWIAAEAKNGLLVGLADGAFALVEVVEIAG